MTNNTLNNFAQHWSSVKPDKLNNFLESKGVFEELDDAASVAVNGGIGVTLQAPVEGLYVGAGAGFDF